MLLLAKAAITGAADSEMQSLTNHLIATNLVYAVRYAYSEQGVPSLREVLLSLTDEGFTEVVIMPLLLPMEPAFNVWITRTVNRWRDRVPTRQLPDVRIATSPAQLAMTPAWLEAWLTTSLETSEVKCLPPAAEGSIVPPQQQRVLVCQGPTCNEAGASVIWGHLRNEQKRLGLRTSGKGVMTCKATCLGPCSLAPVLQVFPEGTYYGGVDEAGIDRIITQHLIGGQIVSDLAYAALPNRQRLRTPSS